MYSHDYGSGLKLMEHSYMKNEFVQRFEHQLTPEGNHHKSRVVWAGDYADEEMDQIIEGTEDDENPSHPNIWGLCRDTSKISHSLVDTSKFPFIVNHSKKQFVDKRETPTSNDGWTVHPLPLLTCEGNGRGGGDYRTDNAEIEAQIGIWARDVISVEETAPEGYDKFIFSVPVDW